MRHRHAWQVDILTVGAVVSPLAALIVVLVDTYLTLSRPASASALLNGQIPWFLVAIPLLLIAGIFIGLRAGAGVAVLVILVAIAVERFSQSLLPGGGINVRLDELLVPTITLGVLTREWAQGRLWESLRRIPGLLLLGSFLLANLIPTVLMPDRARGASLFVILLAGALCYIGVAVLVKRIGPSRLEDLVMLLMVVGALEATFGLVTLGLSIWQGVATPIGVQVEPVSGLFEAYGTMFEANFLGQYLASIFLVAIAFLWQLASQRQLRSQFALVLAVAAVLSAVGVLGSETRASWLGLMAGVVVMAALWGFSPSQERREGARDAQIIGRWLPSLALLAVMLALVAVGLVFASAGTPIGDRFSSLVDFTSGSGYGRLRILQLVLSDLRNPIIGMGDGSFNLALPVAPGSPPDPHPWIYSMFLAVLHDSGVVGLLLWLAFLAMIYHQLLRVVRSTVPQSVRTFAIGMTAVLTCLLISAQSTTSMYLIFFWVFLGLASSLPLLTAPLSTTADQPSPTEDVAATEAENVRLPKRVLAVSRAQYAVTGEQVVQGNLTSGRTAR